MHAAQTPFINEVGLAFTSNDDALAKAFESCSHNRTMDDVISWDFCQWLIEWSHEDAIEQSLTVAFPAIRTCPKGSHGKLGKSRQGVQRVCQCRPVAPMRHLWGNFQKEGHPQNIITKWLSVQPHSGDRRTRSHRHGRFKVPGFEHDRCWDQFPAGWNRTWGTWSARIPCLPRCTDQKMV